MAKKTTTKTSKKATYGNIPSITLRKETGTDRSMRLTWGAYTPTTGNYGKYFKEYQWRYGYSVGPSESYYADTTSTTGGSASFSAPSNAFKVWAEVRAISKNTGKVNHGNWTRSGEYIFPTGNLSAPSTPTASLDDTKTKLNIYVEDLNPQQTYQIQLGIVTSSGFNSDSEQYQMINLNSLGRANHQMAVASGKKYRVRARAYRILENKPYYSDWSSYCSEIETLPAAPANLSLSLEKDMQVKANWTMSSSADEYEIEYTTKKEYFDASSETTTVTAKQSPFYISGIGAGQEYFFRIRSKNSVGESAWWPSDKNKAIALIIGSAPSAPTTWSSTTSAKSSSEVILYWVHNTQDGSREKKAEVYIDNTLVTTINSTRADDDPENISKLAIQLPTVRFANGTAKQYKDGSKFTWKVRTQGIFTGTNSWSEFSTERTVEVYEEPQLTLSTNSLNGPLLEHLPLEVRAILTPATQEVMSYHVSVVTADGYTTINDDGVVTYVAPGEEVFSKYYDISDNPFNIKLSAEDLTLASGKSYTLSVIAATNVGLTTEEKSITFQTLFAEANYFVELMYEANEDDYSMLLTPLCYDLSKQPPAPDPTPDDVEEEDEDYMIDPNLLIQNMLISLYRIEPNGEFTEIALNMLSQDGMSASDPHPSLANASYRVVIKDPNTGVVNYKDFDDLGDFGNAIIIQWNEGAPPVDVTGLYITDDTHMETAFSGNMVELPYNVDVSESHDIDTSLIEYIGRSHPVSYYGTQLGETASWNTEIPKDDLETINKLRQLAVYAGDVYVREPSGVGYWAKVNVSISLKHCVLTVPVSFSITRVEGGK